MEYFEFHNEIPINTLNTWKSQIDSSTLFKFEGWTGLPREPYRHWAAYPDVEGVYKEIFVCLNESIKDIGLNLKPERLVVNYYNHGDSSWLHEDCTEKNYWTVLLFANPYWNINWGGDFILVEKDDIVKAFWPKPGLFIVFKSHYLHGARPVSREAEYPRLGLAFQCVNQLKT